MTNIQMLNRNILKIIACITMLIDHIGYFIFPEIIVLRIIGRISFPIFAFFIAEGYYYTSNKLKYFILLLGFAIISQIPYAFLQHNFTQLNILFTFVFSLVLLTITEFTRTQYGFNKIIYTFFTLIITLFIIILDYYNCIDYGVIGVFIPFIIYYLRENKLLKFVVFTILLLLFASIQVVSQNNFNDFATYIQIFSILSIPLLLMYNGEKGKTNLKYLFYVFYPLHLLLILLITFI